jgi:carboxymethylenebutenolidase
MVLPVAPGRPPNYIEGMKLRSGSLLGRRTALAGWTWAGAAMAMGVPAARAQVPAEIKAETVSMTMPGNVKFRAKLYVPAKTPAPGIVVVHDGWGPTPDFAAMGASLTNDGIIGLVVDLTGGRLAENAGEAERFAKQVDGEQPGDTISAWYDWLRNRVECNQKIGAFGFGPGGRWAVNGSVHKAAHGVAIWCTRIETPVNDLRSIYELFIGHFSDKDTVSSQVLVAELTQRLKAAQREGHFWRYTSRPAFYNPRSADYDKPDAALAWRRTVSLYRKLWGLGPA